MVHDSVSVYCECTLDGMWTVIQKRSDGSIDFYRNWMDYKDGFGDVSGEYWLGNDVIHQLTSRANYTLRVVLTDWDNVTKYAIYSTFTVADEADGYRLSIGGYSGDASREWANVQYPRSRQRWLCEWKLCRELQRILVV